MSSGRSHPDDAERAERVASVRAGVAQALAAADGAALAALLRADARWIDAAGVHEGPDASGRARAFAGQGGDWAAPQVKGAHAVFRAADGRAVVAELRGGAVVWAAVAP